MSVFSVPRVSSKAFEEFFNDNPDSMLRMVQIVMLRLQRVTFLALNNFLGLGRELINQVRLYLLTNMSIFMH